MNWMEQCFKIEVIGTYVCLGIIAVCLVVYILACFFSKDK